MFCPNCGTKNEEDVLFCASCGTKLQENAVPPVQEATQQPEMPQQPEAPQQQQEMPQQPVMPQQPNFAGGYVTPPPAYNQAPPVMPRAPKQPVKINKLLIAVIAEAAVLVVMIVAFFLVGKNTYGYERVAETYFESVVQGDWSSVYQQLDISESDFVNEAMFIQANANTDTMDINQYQVVSSYDSGLTATVTIQYSQKESSSTSTMQITLNKQSGKKFLFFDSWKVSGEDYIAREFEIDVPAGATVYMDGVQLSESLKDSESSYYYDYYKVPKLFLGDHELYMTMGDFASTKETASVQYDDAWYSLYDFQITQEQQIELFHQAYNDYQKLIQAGVMGQDFASVQDIFTADEQEYARSDYENYYTYKFAAFNEGDKGITDFSMSNVSADFSYNYVSEGKMYAEVCLSFDYTVDYIYHYVGWFYEEQYMDTSSNSTTEYLYYVYEDGTWKRSESNMPYIYY